MGDNVSYTGISYMSYIYIQIYVYLYIFVLPSSIYLTWLDLHFIYFNIINFILNFSYHFTVHHVAFCLCVIVQCVILIIAASHYSTANQLFKNKNYIPRLHWNVKVSGENP